MPNFYQLLSVEPSATPEQIKRAFRNEIARYHPDKVQHLGKEFQEMAASRAAALTEAYRTLMSAELRAEYDRTYIGAPAATATAAAPHPPSPSNAVTPDPPPAQPDRHFTPPPRFAAEHRDRDDCVRRATLGRFRTALTAEVGTVEEVPTRDFDLDFTVKAKKLFSRNEGQRFAVKVVPSVDKLAVQEAWGAAQKAASPICIFLMGSRLSPAKELADVITDLRKRTRGGHGISLIPIDVRDWSAHMPSDVPDSCRNVLKRLRDASSV
ncbi:MAG TPA: J domain-containing protein [Vicinamibacterales bacterium]|nr:J domain-containing protein [Vicinamibacterales bacterium]